MMLIVLPKHDEAAFSSDRGDKELQLKAQPTIRLAQSCIDDRAMMVTHWSLHQLTHLKCRTVNLSLLKTLCHLTHNQMDVRLGAFNVLTT